jgi:hypothetical protein
LFENEIKITDLKSGDNIYILFERDNPDYYIFLKSKEEVEKNLDKIYKELSEEYGAPLDITKFLEGYIIIEGKISDLKQINDLIKLS